MNRVTLLGPATAFCLLCFSGPVPAHGPSRWSIGVSIGSPGYYRPGYCCHEPWWYYRPRPVYVVPSPVYVAPAPAVIGHVYSPSPPPVVEPIPSNGNGATLPPPRRLDDSSLGSEEGFRRALADPDERVRLEAVTQLGRMKAVRMVDPLAATLAGDPSPAVREAAARALALIASPSAMPALLRAAQVDQSHDVRRTAQFAIEIIQSK